MSSVDGLLGLGVLATEQRVEEARRRQLLVVANHDHLPPAQDGPQRIDRLDLARFVEDHEVERQAPCGRNVATESGLIMNTGLIAWIALPARCIS